MISECYLVEPFICKEADKVSDIAKKLKKFDQRHIYVVTESNQPTGIISISDILEKIVVDGKDGKKVLAKEIMTKSILVFDDATDLRKAYTSMNEKGVVSCAITVKNKMVGILTLKEAIRYITDPKNVMKW